MEWKELCENSDVRKIESGFLYAAFTDELVFSCWPPEKEQSEHIKDHWNKALECRIFDEKSEYRIARTDLGKEWKYRFAVDRESGYEDFFDEVPYLDIDDTAVRKKENGTCEVRATGGGRYELPVKEVQNLKLRIRNYVKYYENSGQAYVSDWRMAGLERGKEK